MDIEKITGPGRWKDNIGKIVLGDCMDVLRQMPDGAVDVLLTDPPYGMTGGAKKCGGRFGGRFERYGREVANAWDVAPPPEVFREMFRVSKEQIIWGGNYFELPPTRCFNVWRKLTISEGFSMAMCEYAWTSFCSNAKFWEFAPQDAERFHATQKPLGLICRQLEEYTKPGDLVLDCFSGSGTVACACYLTGRRFIACEVNAEYHARSVERLQALQAQPMLL